jgi:hypothetical protein
MGEVGVHEVLKCWDGRRWVPMYPSEGQSKSLRPSWIEPVPFPLVICEAPGAFSVLARAPQTFDIGSAGRDQEQGLRGDLLFPDEENQRRQLEFEA